MQSLKLVLVEINLTWRFMADRRVIVYLMAKWNRITWLLRFARIRVIDILNLPVVDFEPTGGRVCFTRPYKYPAHPNAYQKSPR